MNQNKTAIVNFQEFRNLIKPYIQRGFFAMKQKKKKYIQIKFKQKKSVDDISKMSIGDFNSKKFFKLFTHNLLSIIIGPIFCTIDDVFFKKQLSKQTLRNFIFYTLNVCNLGFLISQLNPGAGVVNNDFKIPTQPAFDYFFWLIIIILMQANFAA